MKMNPNYIIITLHYHAIELIALIQYSKKKKKERASRKTKHFKAKDLLFGLSASD
jgi:hypothetical protein